MTTEIDELVEESGDRPSRLPVYKDWSVAAIRLLQGAVGHDDPVWGTVLRYQTPLADYFARIGLTLVVDESEGLAYIRQMADDEAAGEYQDLPRLFRRTRLSYEATLLCVLLRDALRRFEEEELDDQRLVVDEVDLFDQWKSFFPTNDDEVRLRKLLEAAFRKLDSLKFVKRFGEAKRKWEVRRILKARLPVEQLEKLREQLHSALSQGSEEITHG